MLLVSPTYPASLMRNRRRVTRLCFRHSCGQSYWEVGLDDPLCDSIGEHACEIVHYEPECFPLPPQDAWWDLLETRFRMHDICAEGKPWHNALIYTVKRLTHESDERLIPALHVGCSFLAERLNPYRMEHIMEHNRLRKERMPC